MADTETKPIGKGPAPAECARCAAVDDAVPTAEQLRRMVAGETLDDEAFIPRPMTAEQAAAAQMLAFALGPYIRAFGSRTAGARLAVTVACLRTSAKYALVVDRVREARRPIDDDIRARFERGEIGAEEARDLELKTPTPDYPGKDRDDAWLAGGAR